MVPFQSHPSSQNDKRSEVRESSENLAKKRKWEQPLQPPQINSIFDIELHLETPLPFDWQRCLDIQVLLYIQFPFKYRLSYVNLS